MSFKFGSFAFVLVRRGRGAQLAAIYRRQNEKMEVRRWNRASRTWSQLQWIDDSREVHDFLRRERLFDAMRARGGLHGLERAEIEHALVSRRF